MISVDLRRTFNYLSPRRSQHQIFKAWSFLLSSSPARPPDLISQSGLGKFPGGTWPSLPNSPSAPQLSGRQRAGAAEGQGPFNPYGFQMPQKESLLNRVLKQSWGDKGSQAEEALMERNMLEFAMTKVTEDEMSWKNSLQMKVWADQYILPLSDPVRLMVTLVIWRWCCRRGWCVGRVIASSSRGTGKGSLGDKTISKYSDQRLKLYQRGSTFVPNSICDFSKVKYIGRHFVQYNASKWILPSLYWAILSMKA